MLSTRKHDYARIEDGGGPGTFCCTDEVHARNPALRKSPAGLEDHGDLLTAP